MRILVGYYHYRHPTDVRAGYERWLGRLRTAGIEVHGISLTLDPAGPRLAWPQIEERWGRGDRALLGLYEEVARRAEDFDVFLNYNGTSLHPDFVRQLPTWNVYACWDDPESSDVLSRPVAWAYDLCMVGNVAEVGRYREWGARDALFWPLGFRAEDYDPALTREQILGGERNVDVTLLCERKSGFRNNRLDSWVTAFPDGSYFGPGWSKGFLPESERVPLYQRTKIGPNFHNSTGPINFRTFALPANGVLQICDNKSHLGEIFRLGEEVVGFDDVGEAIELCRYYLAHDEERRQIAAAGWQRALRDYSEVAVFERLIAAVRERRAAPAPRPAAAAALLETQRRKTFWQRLRHAVIAPFAGFAPAWGRVGRSLRRREPNHLRALRLGELRRAIAFFPPGARVLEIGAGAGWQAAELARQGFHVEAVDVAGSTYAAGRVWPVREYDGHCLPFADAGFAVVWSSNVLEHVAALDAFETEIRRVLAPGGIAVHALPTASWRFWTSLAHYPKLPWLAAELWRKKSAPVALLRSVRLLLPSRHGERGNAWSELWCFSRFFWRRHFERCGFHLETRRPCGLFYTGYDLLGARLPLVIRRALSRILGSACALYVLRPR